MLCAEVFTCFDDVTKLVEQEFVVSSSVQTLLHVAVQFVHHSLHICVLVLLDTRHSTQVASQLDGFQNGRTRQIVCVFLELGDAGASGSSETANSRSSQRRLNASCH